MITERQLSERLSRLPRSIDPDQDLWPGIEQRLVRAPRRRGPLVWATAASIAVALVIGVRSWDSAPTDAKVAATDTTIESPTRGVGQRLASQVDLQYSGALRSLARAVDPAAMPSDAGELTLSLRKLQRATEDIRAALEMDPDAIYLAELLESTHRQRIRLLRSLAMADIATLEEGRRT